jgi:uncharacterized protein (TIGR02147 family)
VQTPLASEPQSASPDVLDFDNPREFLARALDEARRRNPRAGLRAFARRAGITSSMLSMVLNGRRRFSPAVAAKIAEVLKLTGRRRRYLLSMAALEFSENEKERSETLSRLVRLRSLADRHVIENRQVRYLANWFYPAIFVMAGQEGFDPDPKRLVRRLGRGVTVAQVEEALLDLVALGLLEKRGDTYRQSFRAIDTGEDLVATALRAYHFQMNSLAAEALALPLSEREFNGLTIAVPEDRLNEVKERIRMFRHELNESLSRHTCDSAVYQINVQLFPLAAKAAVSEGVA